MDGENITGGIATQALIEETMREISGIPWLDIVRLSVPPTLSILSPS